MHPAISTQVARLPRKLASFLLFAPAVFLTGCATNTETGALAGAGVGALGGAIVGSALHRPGLGAAIGAGAGAVTGAAIGHAEDKREARDQAQAIVASQQAQSQGMQDIARMASGHVADDIIINQVRTSPVVYNLGADQIEYLKRYSVSDAVIREMQMTRMRVPQGVYVENGVVYQPAPVVVYEEPPPVAVGVGVGFHRRW